MSILAFAGCTGGGGGGGGATTTIVEGRALNGPIRFGSARLYELNADGTRGVQIGVSGSTWTRGNFSFLSLSQQSATGFLLVEVVGASSSKYRDEFTGQDVAFGATDKLQAVFRQTSGIDRVAVTPLTTMAAARAMKLASQGAPLDVAVDSSNRGLAQQYGLSSIVTVLPVDPSDATRTQVAGREARIYGLILAAIARLANLTSTPSGYTSTQRAADLAIALAQDAEDGLLDGLDSTAAAIPFPLPTVTIPLGTTTATLAANAGTADLQASLDAFMVLAKNKTNITTHWIAATAVPVGVASRDALRIVTTALPVWISNVPGEGFLEATGGTPPYTWSWTGSVPAGFTLQGNGIQGKYLLMGVGTTRKILGPFTVTVMDSAQPPASASLQLFITVAQPPPAINLLPISPAPVVGTPFDQVIVNATGGVGPYYYTLQTGGGFPPIGLILSPDGRLSGTPSIAGSATFGVCAVDIVGSMSCTQVTVDVTPAAPSGGGGGGVAAFDGTYDANVTTVTPLGTTSGAGTFSSANGSVSDPGGTFVGTVQSDGTFTGTTSVCTGCSPMAMTGTFSTSSSFTISGASGNVSQTIVATKR